MALAEDIGSGDITTNILISEGQKGEAYVVAKEDMILSGIGILKRVFQLIPIYPTLLKGGGGDFAPHIIKFKDRFRDGEIVKNGRIIIEIGGDGRAILTGERTALNFLQRMSGIATITKKYVDSVRRFNAKIIDTRKTTPGLRILEKYAVRCGGGYNHRLGLSDGIIIKDNHIKAAGGIINAVERIWDDKPYLMKIEVETKDLKEVRDALKCSADVIMLDNMDIPTIKKAVKLI
ncbi:MAG: carboxylating nicotinate-nucleotide diphosphorylase, partial [Nitrospinota bacterium]